MSEQAPKNPLDEMSEDQEQNGTPDQTDAQPTGDVANTNTETQQSEPSVPDAQQQVPPQAPENPEPAAPTADPQAATPSQEGEQMTPPEPVMPRAAASRHGQEHGIFYGKRKREIADVLKKQPKVSFMIPRQENELNGLAYETVQINGHRMEIQKGVMVTIPKQVAEILAEKYRVQLEAGSDKRIDRSEDQMDRLS